MTIITTKITIQNMKYLQYEITVSIQYTFIVNERSCLSTSYSCSCVVLEEGTQRQLIFIFCKYKNHVNVHSLGPDN